MSRINFLIYFFLDVLKKDKEDEEDEVLIWEKLSDLIESHPNRRFLIGIDGLDALTSHQHLQVY